MEYPWRPMPQSGHVCPVCSNPHFPFCPPPPPQYYRRPPPPPPDQLFHSPLLPLPAAYNPFIDHQGGPEANLYSRAHPITQVPARPWNPNSNYSKDCYPNFNPRLDHDNNGPVTAKRFRFDIVDENYPGRLLVEDERRLKLIRDHGVVEHCSEMNSSTGYRFRSHSFGQSNLGDTKISGNPEYGEKQFPYQHTENEKNVGSGRLLFGEGEGHVMQNDGYGYIVREFRMHRSPGRTNEVQLDDNADFQEHTNNVATENWEFKNQLNHFPEAHSNKQRVVEPRAVQYGIANQVQSSLLTSPSPSIIAELSMFRSSEAVVSSLAPFHSPFTKVPEIIAPVSNVYSNLSGSYSMKKRALSIASAGEKPSRDPSLDQPKIVDASHIIKHPHRANRPDHIVIILRGLPGSGKSYMAKVLRDHEIENGGSAPRIYSMDEYFMTEVEKVEESVRSRSSGSVRGKKTVTKKVMEYCYEPEMEEAYRASMLRAFKKTLDEGTFPFVIVDDRNLRVADFAQFWATAKRSGYEVYLLEAEYKDPAGCAARNIHGFTQNEIHKLASRWEEAPSLYMKLDIKSLLQGDDSEENGIQEVDMDAEDENHVICTSGSDGTNIPKIASPQDGDLALDAPLKDERAEDSEEHRLEVVKELGKSKWSNDLDEDGLHKIEATIGGNSSALSSLVRSYEEKGKSVRWADQIGRIGFSIGARTTASMSLIIGAGSGYNSKSNPVVEEERLGERSGESRKRNVFEEQLRAERESFRAVFDMRKQRITGLLHGHEQ